MQWYVLALLLSAGAVWLLGRVAGQRLLDHPGARSSHDRPTPTGGGLGACLAWLVVAAIAGGALGTGPRWHAALAVAVPLAAVGLVDDLFDLPRSLRFGVQLAAAAVAVWFLGPLPIPLPPAVVAAISVVGLAVFINQVNFMDGMDALVGGSGSVALLVLGKATGDPFWYLVAAAYAGFLVHNLPPARIFMGDAGSTVLGGLLGIAVLSGWRVLRAEHLLVLVPLMGDSTYTLIRRLIRRENIFRAHHSHIYQRLLRAGHGHGAISAGYAVLTAMLGGLGLWGGRLGGLAGLAISAGLLLAAERYLSMRAVPFRRPG